MKIFVVTHKKYNFPNDDVHFPIQVNSNINDNLGYLKDNAGDNISSKNNNYCELTALYWVWKNNNDDIVGISHYRRYFFKNHFSEKYNNIISKSDIEKLLNNSDIIVPEKNFIAKYNIKQQYKLLHNLKDYELCRNVIEKKYPNYVNSFDKISKRKYFYPYNMFIMKKEIFDSYCSWLFDILFEIETNIDLSSYDQYNQRIYGFLSERLFNVWLDYNSNYKIKEVPVYNIEENLFKQNIKSIIKRILFSFNGDK